MASLAERDRIERWVGTIDWTADEAQFDTWISRFGEPEAAALQYLTRRRSDLVLAPTNVGSGSDRVDHSRNLSAIEDLISDLVSWINGNLDDLSLTPEGEDLVAGAGAGAADETIIVDTIVHAPRRG